MRGRALVYREGPRVVVSFGALPVSALCLLDNGRLSNVHQSECEIAKWIFTIIILFHDFRALDNS